MRLVYWVTEDCNLACSYCYVNKNQHTMTREIAEKSILLFQHKCDKDVEEGRKINISFHGGEPTLNFSVIKYLIEWYERRYSSSVVFEMTTNGVVQDKHIYDYIAGHVQISLSLDGNRVTNDKNRLTKDGESSYEKAFLTLAYLKEKGCILRIRMTVNKSTLPDLFDNYVYLDRLNTDFVVFALDARDCWNRDDMSLYEMNLRKIMDYVIDKDEIEAKYFLYNTQMEFLRPRGICNGGVDSVSIGADGSIYPCMMSVGYPEFILGNVFQGLDEERIQRLKKLNIQPVIGCQKCTMIGNCSCSMCKIINKRYTGDYNEPSPFLCHETGIMYRICKDYQYLITGFHPEEINV